MTHSTSSKQGFELYHRPTGYKFERDMLLQVLKKESDLRLCEETQEAYTHKGTELDCNAYMAHIRDVTEMLQVRALLECGVQEDDLKDALVALRNHRLDYKDDEEILQASIYGRYDLCFDRKHVAQWSPVPDCQVVGLNGEEIGLLSLLTPGRPALIIAASLS